MHDALKTILSAGAALGATPFARSLMHPSAADPLAWVGLERRSPRTLERAALIGAGALLGAGAALLLAPASGAQTRRKLAEKANSLTEEAKQAAQQAAGYLQETVQADAKTQQPATHEPETSNFAHS